MTAPVRKRKMLHELVNVLQRDGFEAVKARVLASLKSVAVRDETKAQIMAVGGDVDEAIAYIDQLTDSTSLTLEDGRRLVVGRLLRGEPIKGCK